MLNYYTSNDKSVTPLSGYLYLKEKWLRLKKKFPGYRTSSAVEKDTSAKSKRPFQCFSK